MQFHERVPPNVKRMSLCRAGVWAILGFTPARSKLEAGGDLAIDDAEGFDDRKQAEGKEEGLRFVALPDGMVEQLRVSLHVWRDERDVSVEA